MKRFVRFAITLFVAAHGVAGKGASEGVKSIAGDSANARDITVNFSSEDRRLAINGPTDPGAAHELRLSPEGLDGIETGADVNEPGIIYLPPPSTPNEQVPSDAVTENYFFFNELIDAPGWQLVVEFSPDATGTWKLNGRFSPLGGELSARVMIPVSELEHGENLLHVRSAQTLSPKFYFRHSFARGERIAATLRLSRPSWFGRVTVFRETGGTLSQLSEQSVVADPALLATRAVDRTVDLSRRNDLTDAALAVGRNLLGARVRRPGSLFEDGFNLVYDTTHQSYRMPHWIWAWGPSIDLLFRLSHLEAAKRAGLGDSFRDAAEKAARRSLQFEITEAQHPARGVSTVRWEPSRATPLGWAEYISTADSLFLAGWGWMSAYAETRDPVFLNRTRSLTAAAERLMSEYPVIPQDWIVERARWTPHTLDESVFGTIGFRRLHEAAPSPSVAAAGQRFLDSHLKHMGRADGLLARAWLRDEDKEIWDPDIKGHAWVIEGYLDAYRLSRDDKYLELSRQLARRVMACQSDEGGFTFLFKRPANGDLIDDKGTAIWAYLFYDLYKFSHDPEHLAAARNALRWCLRHQDRSDDPRVAGGLLHTNSMAYVKRRPMTILYSTTFFGLALLEELALTNNARASR